MTSYSLQPSECPPPPSAHVSFDGHHGDPAMMIDADRDLGFCRGWRDCDWGLPATTLEGSSMAGTILETAGLAPGSNPGDVEQAWPPGGSGPKLRKQGSRVVDQHGWQFPRPAQAPRHLANGASHTKRVGSGPGSSISGAPAQGPQSSVQTKPRSSSSSRGPKASRGGRRHRGHQRGTHRSQGRRLRKYWRVITNRTGLRIMFIPLDMHRALGLNELFPLLISARRARTCTVNLVLATGLQYPVTMAKATSNRHVHRRFTTGWRGFCEVAGVEVGDELRFVRKSQSETLMVHVIKKGASNCR